MINEKNNKSLIQYLEEIKNYKILTREEEQLLFIRLKNGDKTAKEEIIKSNLKLVVSVAKKYKDQELQLIDLIQLGNEGLIYAIDKFDYKTGNKFSTYATWQIRKKITRGIEDYSRVVKIPVYMFEKIKTYKKNYIILHNKLGYKPSRKEMIEQYNYNENELDIILFWLEDVKSLNETVSKDNDTETEYFIEDTTNDIEENYIKKSLREELDKLLDNASLTDKERNILYQRINEEKTLEEVASGFGVTRERIRQIENKALQKIRTSEYIDSYLVYADNEKNAKEIIKKARTK